MASLHAQEVHFTLEGIKNHGNKMTRTKYSAKKVWRQADAVCFDVDSTLITEEGIDALAEFCGAGAQVREW